jgi:hypothetical protein
MEPHVGDPILASNLTRRVDYALFMVEALTNDALIHEAPPLSAVVHLRRWHMPLFNEKGEKMNTSTIPLQKRSR